MPVVAALKVIPVSGRTKLGVVYRNEEIIIGHVV